MQDPWKVALAISGGVAGVARSITVDSRGTATAHDERSGETATETLDPDETADLAALVCSAAQAPPAGQPPTCADCFNYVMTIANGQKLLTWTWNDLSLRDHPSALLVQALRQNLQQLLDAPE